MRQLRGAGLADYKVRLKLPPLVPLGELFTQQYSRSYFVNCTLYNIALHASGSQTNKPDKNLQKNLPEDYVLFI